MPDATGTHNDGGVAFGSQVLAITFPTGGAAVNYIANNIQPKFTTRIIESHDQLGRPAREVMIEGQPTGTAQLQFSGPTIKVPPINSRFAFRPVNGASDGSEDIAMKVSELGTPFQAQGETFVDISFRKVLVA